MTNNVLIWGPGDFAIHCYLAWARLVDELLQWPETLCGIDSTDTIECEEENMNTADSPTKRRPANATD